MHSVVEMRKHAPAPTPYNQSHSMSSRKTTFYDQIRACGEASQGLQQEKAALRAPASLANELEQLIDSRQQNRMVAFKKEEVDLLKVVLK